MPAAEDHLLLELDRSDGAGLRAQLERELRAAVRDGRLHPGTRLPSTRALARRLGVSRGVVVEAYAQLVAEGYLRARQGAATRVAGGAAEAPPAAVGPGRARPPAYDLRPGLPDLAAFPRATWLAAMRRVLRDEPHAGLGHPDPRGSEALRDALSGYLGRVRGVVAPAERFIVCTGFAQGLALVCQSLAAQGARRVALEDPSFVLHRWIVQASGLEPVPVPVDAGGLRVDLLAAADADAVLVTPAHQSPTGVVLAPARRTGLVAWARRRGAVIVEDDYDAEFRYDREPVGALQGLAPDLVVYGGSATKTLAPALRLGWLAVPAQLADALHFRKLVADAGSPVLGQLVLADLLRRGDHDRHLRRMRLAYRRRRDALVAAVAEHLPDARVSGVAAGLQAMVTLAPGTDEGALVAAARARDVAVEGGAHNRFAPGPPALLVGYAAVPEPGLREAVRRLGLAARDL